MLTCFHNNSQLQQTTDNNMEQSIPCGLYMYSWKRNNIPRISLTSKAWFFSYVLQASYQLKTLNIVKSSNWQMTQNHQEICHTILMLFACDLILTFDCTFLSTLTSSFLIYLTLSTLTSTSCLLWFHSPTATRFLCTQNK